MNRKKILIIGAASPMTVEQLFNQTEANISLVHDEDDGIRELCLSQPELIIVDIDIPGKLGLNILRKLRRNTTVPIIAITPSNGVSTLSWFNAGADISLHKPVTLDDLLAYTNSILSSAEQRSGQQHSAIYDDGHLTIDPLAYRIRVGGSSVKLTPLEFKLLLYLVNNSQTPCTYSQILDNVWGVSHQNHKEYVHTFIWQLRQKLEQNPQQADYIESVHGIGYRFKAHPNGKVIEV